MKLRVQRSADRKMETITLIPPVSLEENCRCLSSGEGMDHYFTEEGFYDGWGMNVEERGLSTEPEGVELIKRIESEREVE